MKFKLTLFTLLIGMMSFAGIRAETPDLEKSSTITPESLSIDMAVSQVMNVSNVLIAAESPISFEVESVILPDHSGFNQLIKFEVVAFKHADLGSSTPTVIFTKQFYRKPRDGFRCK